MASELRRPPTRTGSGSRPPTSRFQEGSMNDRTSAAPPAQFLGPEQLKDYETQFYAEPPKTHEARRPRPFSASGQLQVPRNSGMQELQPPKHTVIHKKSMGFFGRVRDALFHRGGGHHGAAALKEQDVHRKHSSLQEPLQRPHMPPPPRREFLQHAARTRSEVNIAQMFSDPTGGVAGDRPSREEVLASYNQLVASGFFQSHAIQSTRHAAPTSAAGARQPPVLPMDPQAAPRPPMRLSSMRKTARPSSVSPMPVPAPSVSPNPQSRNSREFSATAMGPPAAPRTSLSSLFRPSFPDLNTKDSRYALRGRKRTRGDETPVTTPEPQSSSSTSYFTQPLKRVAKKLREMPSTSSQLNEKATATKNNNSNTFYVPQGQSDDTTSADGIMRLVPSISTGGSLYPNDRPIRLRSPSPAVPETTAAERRSERPVREPVISAATRAKRPRRTFSYTVTESPRGRTRAAERERQRELRSKLQRRGSSATRADDATTPRSTRQTTTTHTQNPLGQWQRVSVEDTIIHRDSSDSTQWDWEWEQRQTAEVRIASSPGHSGGGGNKLRKRVTPSPSPLRAIADGNKSIPKTPERWHHSGKAYHLKDRGSRPDLTLSPTPTGVRHSEDSGKDYGKENDWRRLDADGDVDVLAYENAWPRHNGYAQQEMLQWRIGNAL